MPLQAVIFDLDGVLVSTSKFHARAWEDLVRSLGFQPPADLEERVKGVSRMESLLIALGDNAARFTQAQLAALAERKNDCYLEVIKGITPADLLSGAAELLVGLTAAGVKLAIGSASKNARAVLERLGVIGRFDAIADGFSYTRGKPDPELFLAAAVMLFPSGVSAADCVVVEDAAVGIDAALAGGFVAVGVGNYESLKHAHLYVRSLTELSCERLQKLIRP